ncbi:type II toxin-antitoxin system VapC family toxin [Rhodohalobacter barkolensis]|uniref:Pilus assembly protein n=1 Tax=Rhodohalobacter barkolensis TaxID=2053187 RepID=A0A2N0VKC1_9BACT|nr:PIN domain-containing protein [Rhodohalobacter barkolensis]PKD44628.1 pilus assembly protein [Rhodohalobacter barkolensis]
MKNSLIDAGPIIALFDNTDQHHEKVLSFLKEYHGRLTTTWPVLTEACYMLDFNRNTQLDFIDWIIAGGLDVYNLQHWQIGAVRDWFVKYSDLPADLADCTLLEAAESQNIDSIITLDQDFSVYKLNNGKYLNNLIQ